jgi:hypothetical protein
MSDSINPAFKPILDVLPPEFHNMIIPTLKEWDKGVQQKFTEIHSSYDELKPFKKFVENNVDADYAWQATVLTDKLQREPEATIAEINKTWELGFVSKDEAAQLAQNSAGGSTDGGDLFGSEDNDISKHPQFVAMQKALEQVQGTITSKQQQEQEEQAIAEFNRELDALEKKYTQPEEGDPLPFHRTFVTALMANGLSGDEAVKQYHQVLAGNSVSSGSNDQGDNSSTDEPPVVMGNGGSVGSGQDNGAIDFSSLPRSEFTSTVADLVRAQMESGQG